ncbi:MAG: hypothetical protein FWD36_04095 [Treponema sp.]|nr:hypothetical protein [Treponema sp.]
MRRITIALLLISLSSFLISCPFTAPEKKPALSKGPMVNLSIGFDEGSPSSRALTDLMALVAVQRFEVAFYHGPSDQVYRAVWARGERGQLWVPAANYGPDNGEGNAVILFAGFSNYTLLAIGELIAVNGVQDATIIGETSTSATFSLTPLNNDVFGEDEDGSPDPSESSFKITGYAPRNGQDTSDWDEYLNGGNTPGLTTFKTQELNGYTYPIFELPPNGIFQAEYAINFGGITQGVVAAGDPRVITGFVEDEPLGISVFGTIENITHPGNAIPAGGIYELKLTTTAIPGLMRLSIDIPVNALHNNPLQNPVAPITWRIQGGILNTALDRGKASESTGGAILVRVPAPPSEPAILTIYDGGLMPHIDRSRTSANIENFFDYTAGNPLSRVDFEGYIGTDRFGESKQLLRIRSPGETAFQLFSAEPINLLEHKVTALSFWAYSTVEYLGAAQAGVGHGMFRIVGFGDAHNDELQRMQPYLHSDVTNNGDDNAAIPAHTWKRFIIPVPPMLDEVTITRIFYVNFMTLAGNEIYLDDIKFVSNDIVRTFGTISVPATIPNAPFNAADLLSTNIIDLVYRTDDGSGITAVNPVVNLIQSDQAHIGLRPNFHNWFNCNPIHNIIRVTGATETPPGSGIYTPTGGPGSTFTIQLRATDAIGTVTSNIMEVEVVGP